MPPDALDPQSVVAGHALRIAGHQHRVGGDVSVGAVAELGPGIWCPVEAPVAAIVGRRADLIEVAPERTRNQHDGGDVVAVAVGGHALLGAGGVGHHDIDVGEVGLAEVLGPVAVEIEEDVTGDLGITDDRDLDEVGVGGGDFGGAVDGLVGHEESRRSRIRLDNESEPEVL